jgi:hypothetical protein
VDFGKCFDQKKNIAGFKDLKTRKMYNDDNGGSIIRTYLAKINKFLVLHQYFYIFPYKIVKNTEPAS